MNIDLGKTHALSCSICQSGGVVINGYCPDCYSSWEKVEKAISLVTVLMESVTGLSLRFHLQDVIKDTPNRELMKSRLPMLVEELGEHSKALNSKSVDHALEELVDLLYTSLQEVWLMLEVMDKPIQRVIEKNAQKTHETHEINPGGKIVRKVEPV